MFFSGEALNKKTWDPSDPVFAVARLGKKMFCLSQKNIFTIDEAVNFTSFVQSEKVSVDRTSARHQA